MSPWLKVRSWSPLLVGALMGVVVKTMATAMIVGGFGVYALHSLGWVNLHITGVGPFWILLAITALAAVLFLALNRRESRGAQPR